MTPAATRNGIPTHDTQLRVTAVHPTAIPPMAPQRTHRRPSHVLTARIPGMATIAAAMHIIVVARRTDAKDPGRGWAQVMRFVAWMNVRMWMDCHHVISSAAAAVIAATR